ncbi:MAG: hypothetical protein LKJ94_04970 [Candidatus Methanomethylophilus sp.]|nr:hypothetical protein [Methanomethylophilus sp.]MCI2075039.1 hypothetical protein [Methanomethylophilus sp.]MCI2092381.1 hypothetical protein [Methanomethylophilus sp.]WII08480.1 hypothetical protein O8W32_04725 [Methanomassiliicoccales archaeon LGM-DZ1]
MSVTVLWADANIAKTARHRNSSWIPSHLSLTKPENLPAAALRRDSRRTATAAASGMATTYDAWNSIRAASKSAPDPQKIMMYTGISRTCRTRFIGRMLPARATLPPETLVNTRYQSVQGVTRSRSRPVLMSASE